MANVSGGAPFPVVVADVGPHIITFVGMNGNRLRMPVGRISAWNFMTGYPRVAATCQTPGCTHAGFLRYSQRGRAYFVCPRHLPIGITAEIVQETPNDVTPLNRPTLACPGCDSPDPIENFGYADEAPETNWALLTCPRCPQRWIAVWPPETEPGLWAVNTLLSILHACERRQIQPTGIRMHPNMMQDLRRDPRQEPWSSGERESAPSDPHFANIPITIDSALNIPAILNVPTDVRSTRSVQRLGSATPGSGGVSRLGGQPNRILSSLNDGLIGPRTIAVRQEELRNALLTEQVAQIEQRAELRTAEQQVATPDDIEAEILEGSAWVQRSTGNIMHVLRLDSAVDGTRVIVYCNKGEENEPAMRMVVRDFLANHRAYVAQEEWPTIEVKPVVEITSGEEWEFTGTPSVGINVIAVDHKKEVVHVEELDSKRKRTISFSEFIQKRWRKVVRKTAYQWLLEGEGIDGDDL